MATPAHRLIQDQNLNILYNGTTPAGKTDVAKADKKGGLARRKALNDISNSRKPSVLPSGKKETSTKVIAIEKDPFAAKAKSSKAPEKGKVSGRKALSDLTNSVKPPSKPVPNTGRKLNAVTEENIPSSLADERFVHNHRECIKAQMKAIDKDYFLESVGLNNDIPMQQLSAKRALQLSSNKPENNTMNRLEIEEMPEHLFENQVLPQCKKLDPPGYSSPACLSPKSPRSPYMNWDEEGISDLLVIEMPNF